MLKLTCYDFKFSLIVQWLSHLYIITFAFQLVTSGGAHSDTLGARLNCRAARSDGANTDLVLCYRTAFDLNHLPTVVLCRLQTVLHYPRFRLQRHHEFKFERTAEHFAWSDQPVFRQSSEALASHCMNFDISVGL